MIYRIFFVAIVCCLVSSFSFAQLLVNDGTVISIDGTALVHVDGGVQNNINGSFQNSGTLELSGDWANNSGNPAFVPSLPGTVKLIGANELIGGSSVTDFYNLELLGTGVKSLNNIDANVQNLLTLNNRELSTGSNKAFVLNPLTSSIARTTGFVSSSPGGVLVRNTNSAAAYSFPVGSSAGTPRYRPVDISPNQSSTSAYAVRFANVDPTTENYDVTKFDSTLCDVNSLYYHFIDRLSGTASADISIYYDSLNDGHFNAIGGWKNIPDWENNETASISAVGSIPSAKISIANHSDFSFKPYALGNYRPPIQLFGTDSLCLGDTIHLTATSGFSFYTFIVDGVTIQSDSSNSFITASASSTSDIRVTAPVNGHCNTTSVPNPLIFFPLPVANAGTDQTIIAGKAATLQGDGGVSYLWSPPQTLSCFDCQNPNASPGENTSYVLQVTDINGCKMNDTVDIFIDQSGSYFLPTAFSPNQDGENDVLYLLGHDIKEMKLTIYDRWGEKVFQSTSQKNGWDGTYKGEACNSGVFVYYLTVKLFSDDKLISEKGNISLVK